MGKLEGKVAVITGAASGIGKATALRFAAEGARVVIADLNETGGEAAAFECREAGGLAVFQCTDVARESDIQAAIERAVTEFGRLDILFNNAGVAGAMGAVEEIDAAQWDATMAIHLRAAFLGIKHAVPRLRAAGGGSIISTASVAGMRAAAGPLAYSVAKAAIIHLTKCAAEELGKDLIRVNCICPGGIVTPMLSSRMPGGDATVRRFLDTIQPIPRAGEPGDIAAAALFLAGDESRWITGTAMVVDGGLTTGGGGALPGAVRAAWRSRRWSGPSFE